MLLYDFQNRWRLWPGIQITYPKEHSGRGGVPLDITCDTLLYSNSLRRRPKLSVALGESNKRRARNCLVATAKLDVERLFVTSLVLRTGTAGEPITLARTLVSL